MVDTVYYRVNQEAQEEGIEILNLLLAHGADIHKKYNTLHVTYDKKHAASDNPYTFISVEENPDTSVCSCPFKSVFQLAYVLNCEKMICFLREQGEDDTRTGFDIQKGLTQLPNRGDFSSWRQSVQDFFTINTNGAQLRYGKPPKINVLITQSLSRQSTY